MPTGGLARQATAIAQLREQGGGAVLLLDSGNSLFALKPTETADTTQGALPVQAMNAMRYDAMALGERDLAAESGIVTQRLQEAAFPLLSANLEPAGILPNVRPYLLREVAGHTVAVIGVTAPAAASRLQALGLSGAIGDPVQAVRRVVGEVGSQAEVILVLSNLDDAANRELAREVPGLDAIVGVAGGRTMKPEAVAGPEGQVVLHASYVQGEYLGVLTLRLDAQGRVVSFEGNALALDPDYPNDPEVAQLMQSYGIKP